MQLKSSKNVFIDKIAISIELSIIREWIESCIHLNITDLAYPKTTFSYKK